MKLRIRGNSIRIRVSRPELASVAAQGFAEDRVRFAAGSELRYRLEVGATGGELAAELDGARLRVIVPRAAVDRWLGPEEVGIEGRQALGGGEFLKILVEKDYTCLEPRADEDDAELFPHPSKAAQARG